jgi:carbonic anhydrase
MATYYYFLISKNHLMKKISIFISCSFFFIACNQHIPENKAIATIGKTTTDSSHILTSQVLTKAQQTSLTPDSIITLLKEGNKEFMNDELTIRNNSSRIREAALGQYPKAVILSCLDSRVPVEDVFHCGIGDLFVTRLAGNIVNEDILGSLEFACKVSGSKVIVVLGHEYCGAIKSAIDDVKLGNITALLSKIRPAVVASQTFNGDKTSANPDFVHAVCEKNILLTIEEIRKKSPILNDMETKKELLIIGANYNMNTGEVVFL